MTDIERWAFDTRSSSRRARSNKRLVLTVRRASLRSARRTAAHPQGVGPAGGEPRPGPRSRSSIAQVTRIQAADASGELPPATHARIGTCSDIGRQRRENYVP